MQVFDVRHQGLIALDMDGTLLDPEGQLTARTISALKDARAHGAVVDAFLGPDALRASAVREGIGDRRAADLL